MHRMTPGTETRPSFGTVPRPQRPLSPLPSSRPPAFITPRRAKPKPPPLPKPVPTFEVPSITMRPFERWRIALVIGVTLVGAVAILGLHQLVRYVGATTGAVAEAIKEHPSPPIWQGASPAEAIGAGDSVELPPFDRDTAMLIIASAAGDMAARCGNTAAARARLTMGFEPSGRAETVRVGGNWGKSREGKCLARAMHAVVLPPFAGDPSKVELEVTLAPNNKKRR